MSSKKQSKKKPNSPNTQSTSKKFKVTPEMLKNGDVLCGLVIRFLHNRTKENMFSLLSCLRDSNVFVPSTISADPTMTEVGGKGDNPIMFPVKQSLKITPQIYKATDGNLYIPIYSRQENVRHENLKGASLVNMPYTECLKILKNAEGCSRFVLDPHLYNVVLDEDLVRISGQLPSRLSTK